MSDLQTAFTQICSVIAVIVAAWAAYEAKRAADASKASIEAQIVSSAIDDYFKEKMVSNIRFLRRWRERYGEKFCTEMD